jgi:hypothetical protein
MISSIELLLRFSWTMGRALFGLGFFCFIVSGGVLKVNHRSSICSQDFQESQ